jgi:membrane carboxypeptidase/penicillin-binding protein
MFAFIGNRFLVDFSALEQYQPGRPSVVLDIQGNQWCTFQLDRRNPVALATIAPCVIHAFIAAEDWKFFEHSGISFRAIVRSTLVNLYHRKIVQGASTITQQLVKLLFFDSKRTFKRKIKEQLYALLVERQFTKEQILETYLNHVYFGCGIYGVEAAAQRFFNCSICARAVFSADSSFLIFAAVIHISF